MHNRLRSPLGFDILVSASVVRTFQKWVAHRPQYFLPRDAFSQALGWWWVDRATMVRIEKIKHGEIEDLQLLIGCGIISQYPKLLDLPTGKAYNPDPDSLHGDKSGRRIQ